MYVRSSASYREETSTRGVPAWEYHATEPNYDVNGVVITVVERHKIRDDRTASILSIGEPSHAFAEGHLPAPTVIPDVLQRALASLSGV